MELSGEHVRLIHTALLKAYDLPKLRMMMRMELNLNLSAIAGGDNLSVVLFNLIDWAERNDKVLPLIAGAYSHVPANNLLADLAQQAPGWLEFTPKAPAFLRPGASAMPNWQKAGIELVLIRAGYFLYGDYQRRVYLDAFGIGRTPVTNRQYKVFVDATRHAVPDHWENGRIPTGKEDHPVVYVSQDDAQAFCSWAGVSLPTEQQWEKAARGTNGHKYPWGDPPPDENRCNFNRHVGDTTPVGRYSPQGDSPYGVVDMAGNVWEWCGSEYHWRSSLCGGSWFALVASVRCAYRYVVNPIGFRGIGVGFRILFPCF